MATSLTLTGSGTVGDVRPGWTVTEDATPVAIGDTTGGVGSVDLTVARGTDSEFVIDNASVFTHDLGTISGKVDTVVSNGATDGTNTDVELSLTTLLSRLNVDRVAPPVWCDTSNSPDDFAPYGSSAGQVANSYDIATDPADGSVYITSYGGFEQNLLTVDRNRIIKFDKDGNYLFEFGSAGTGNGQFGVATPTTTTTGPTGIAVSPIDGSVYVADMENRRVQKFNSSGAYVTQWGSAGTGNGQFNSNTPARIAVDSTGAVYVTDRSNARIQKFTSTGTYISQAAITGTYFNSPYAVAVDSSDNVYASLLGGGTSYSNPVIRVFNSLLVFQYDIPITFASSFNPTALFVGPSAISFGPNDEMWIAFLFSNHIVQIDQSGNILDRIYSGYPYSLQANDDYSISVNHFNQTVYMYSRGQQPFSASSQVAPTALRVQGFSRTRIPLSQCLIDYFALVDSSIVPTYTASSNPDVFIPGWSGNLWKYLKDLLSAYGLDIGVVAGAATIRDIGTLTIGAAADDSIARSASLSLDSSATGLSINVKNYNTSAGSGVLYDATDYGKIFSVKVGETVTETVTGNNYPVTLNPVTHTTIADGVPVLPGQYYVIASDNLPVTQSEWIAYGASVTATINQDVPGGIDVTLVGPATEIPGVPPPYSLAISDGEVTRPAFSVTGSGVFTNPETINLLTGADATKTSQEVAQDIDNIFIDTKERAYDRGVWASTLASGPRMTLTVSVPTSMLDGFGLIAGSLWTFKENIYRVVSADIGNAATRLTLTPYITTGDVDALWSADNTGDWDSFWGGNETTDFKIKPLRTP